MVTIDIIKSEVLTMHCENRIKCDSCSMLAQDDNVKPEICHQLFNDPSNVLFISAWLLGDRFPNHKTLTAFCTKC